MAHGILGAKFDVAGQSYRLSELPCSANQLSVAL